MPSESPDQLFRHARDTIDDRPEVGAARNDIVELHLPCRRCRRVDEARCGASQQFENLQPRRCRHHELTIRRQQVLSFEPLDDIGAGGRSADAFGLLQSLTEGLVLDETPGVLHGVDQRTFVVARRRLGLLRLHAWLCQRRMLAVQ